MPVASEMQVADLVVERVRTNKQSLMSWFDHYIQCHRCHKRQARLEVIVDTFVVRFAC